MKRLLAVVLVLAAAGIVVWLARSRGPETGGAAPAFETARAARREFRTTVSATGAVKPQVGAEVRVGSRVSGRVVRLHANIKDQVKKGQVIAELERAELEAALLERRAEARVAEARLSAREQVFPREVEKGEADIRRWDATVALGRKELERQDDLLKKEFSSQQARDQANERLLVAQAQLEASRKALDLVRAQYREELKQAQAELERARAAITGAETQLSYAVLQAPISGVIGSVSTQEGETVAAGLSAPTFVTIIDLGRLQVDAYVDEVDIGKVQVGQRAVFSVDAFPASEFEAKTIAIYPKAIIQDNVVKYVVATEIVTPYEGRLRPEMTATVSIHLETRTVLAIPSRAVRRAQGRNIVHARGGAKEIKVGWKDGPWVEVAAGLEEGEVVILDAPAPEKGGSP